MASMIRRAPIAAWLVLLGSACGSAVPPPPAEAGGARAAPETFRVLFLGNSFTARNDLPRVTARLADGNDGLRLEVQAMARDGAHLHDHLRDARVTAAIESKRWTHVVLQGQSSEPFEGPERFRAAGASLVRRVLDAGATPVLFETWAYGRGDEAYCPTCRPGSPGAMQALLRQEYRALSESTGASYAGVGDAFETVLGARDMLLHGEDHRHPTLAGTYLAACVLYRAITGRAPLGTWHPEELPASEARVLRRAARDRVSPRRTRVMHPAGSASQVGSGQSPDPVQIRMLSRHSPSSTSNFS